MVKKVAKNGSPMVFQYSVTKMFSLVRVSITPDHLCVGYKVYYSGYMCEKYVGNFSVIMVGHKVTKVS